MSAEMKEESSMEQDSSRSVRSRQHKAEAMIAGEQLRLRLHYVKLIKERRYHLRTYPNCLVAQELVDWLTAHKEVPDRQTAVEVMQRLMEYDIIHHVCDKWPMFRDAKLLYRFRKDDGTFPFSIEEKVFVRGHALYERLLSSRDSLLQVREEKGMSYYRSIPGYQLIDWLLQNGEAQSRCQGLDLCRALLDHGIIQHVSQKHHFFDSGLLYQFCVNFRRRRRLAELLIEVGHEAGMGMTLMVQDEHADSPFILRRTSPDGSNFLSDEPCSDIQVMSGVHRGSLTHQLHHTNGFSAPVSLPSAPLIRCNPKSVLMRKVTCEELMSPGAPYLKKVLTVLGDVLGWGFVLRGKSPCYVQAVDPASPAAAAGVKVRQFVCRVNGSSVLHLDYCTLTKLVMTGPRVLILEVMQPLY